MTKRRKWPRKRWIALGVLGLLLTVIIVAPFIADREDRSVDEETRSALVRDGHTFASLERGVAHYQLVGPDVGPVVVLVHGTSGPMTIWDETVPPLVAAGFRVLRFDAYGRGYSDRIDARYDLALFVSQLDELLTAVGVDSPVTLVGSSLGGIVSAQMAIDHPDRVHSVVFIGPAGFRLEASILARLRNVALVGDYLMKTFGDRKLVEHHRKYFVETNRFESRHRAFAEALRFRGSKAAILSTLRHTPLQSYLDGYARYGQEKLPSLLIWGKSDVTFPHTNHESFLEQVPHAKLVTIEGAAHLPMLERPAEVNDAIVSFLRSSPN